jgi:prolipoprotein diacylglyceryltransferase
VDRCPKGRRLAERVRRLCRAGDRLCAGDRPLGELVQPRALRQAVDAPWALWIDPAHRPKGTPTIATYHPTFLYESLWDIGVGVLVIWAGRRFALTHGRTFALYVAAYTVGRGWIEALRVDHANHFFGLRLNDWVSVVVFLAAAGYVVFRRPATAIDGSVR